MGGILLHLYESYIVLKNLSSHLIWPNHLDNLTSHMSDW